MAFGIKQASKVADKALDARKKKASDFMTGLKDFVTSPGGIVTMVSIVLLAWYVHHKTTK